MNMTVPIRNDSGATKYSGLSGAGAALGKKGGKSTTPNKQAAAQQNGAKGGRPNKA